MPEAKHHPRRSTTSQMITTPTKSTSGQWTAWEAQDRGLSARQRLTNVAHRYKRYNEERAKHLNIERVFSDDPIRRTLVAVRARALQATSREEILEFLSVMIDQDPLAPGGHLADGK
jgi:hypothetical protein